MNKELIQILSQVSGQSSDDISAKLYVKDGEGDEVKFNPIENFETIASGIVTEALNAKIATANKSAISEAVSAAKAKWEKKQPASYSEVLRKKAKEHDIEFDDKVSDDDLFAKINEASALSYIAKEGYKKGDAPIDPSVVLSHTAHISKLDELAKSKDEIIIDITKEVDEYKSKYNGLINDIELQKTRDGAKKFFQRSISELKPTITEGKDHILVYRIDTTFDGLCRDFDLGITDGKPVLFEKGKSDSEGNPIPAKDKNHNDLSFDTLAKERFMKIHDSFSTAPKPQGSPKPTPPAQSGGNQAPRATSKQDLIIKAYGKLPVKQDDFYEMLSKPLSGDDAGAALDALREYVEMNSELLTK